MGYLSDDDDDDLSPPAPTAMPVDAPVQGHGSDGASPGRANPNVPTNPPEKPWVATAAFEAEISLNGETVNVRVSRGEDTQTAAAKFCRSKVRR